jgi:Wzt C-terminal domain
VRTSSSRWPRPRRSAPDRSGAWRRLCDEDGRARDTFEIGERVVFHAEYGFDVDVDAPIFGVTIVNERNVIVHGRNSLQHDVPIVAVRAGDRVRVRQWMQLDVAPGRYSFLFGVASTSVDLLPHTATMSHAAIDERTTRSHLPPLSTASCRSHGRQPSSNSCRLMTGTSRSGTCRRRPATRLTACTRPWRDTSTRLRRCRSTRRPELSSSAGVNAANPAAFQKFAEVPAPVGIGSSVPGRPSLIAG